VLSKRYRSRGRVHDIWTDYAAVGRTEEYQSSLLKRIGAYFEITVKLIGAAAISGLKQTVLRSKTDAMRSERT